MGIKKMREAVSAAGLKEPDFETEGFFRVVFHRDSALAGVGKRVGERVGEKLTTNQLKILTLLKKEPTASAKWLSEKIGISLRKIEENLAKLKQKGFLRRIGPARGGYWEIVE